VWRPQEAAGQTLASTGAGPGDQMLDLQQLQPSPGSWNVRCRAGYRVRTAEGHGAIVNAQIR